MAITLQECIVDLGSHGLLALTLDCFGPPQPAATRHGYARWYAHPGQASGEDRAALFTLTVSGPAGQGDTWPDHVHPLQQGHALVVFGQVRRGLQVVRIIDVARGQLRWECTVPALREALGVVPEPYMPLDAVVTAHGDQAFHMHLGSLAAPLVRVQLDPPALLPLQLQERQRFAEWHFGAGHLLEWERGSKLARSAAWDGGAQAGPWQAWQAAPANRRFEPTLARRGTRLVFALPRGVVQWVDLAAPGQRHSLRPSEQELSAEPRGVSLSPSGRHLLQPDGTLRAGWVVDLDAGLRAPVQLPDWDPQEQPGSASPPLRLRAAWAITDLGGCVLEGGTLHFTPYEALDWQPLPAPPAGAAGAKPQAPAEALLAPLRRPSLALRPARRGTRPLSHAHGAPHLAPGTPWPEHGGQPMALLCELALPEVHAAIAGMALPPTGWLQLFVALDAEGEPLLDDAFNPVALHVRHEASAAATPAALPPGHVSAQPLRCEPDRADLPPPTHPAVQALSDPHAYARWYDARGEVKPGWRLGGYASALQPQVPEAEPAAAAPWTLLLQVDSDDAYMWGTDSGLLHVLLPPGDAARGDFSRAVGFTQGF